MKLKDREALKDWEQFRKELIASTPVDSNEDPKTKKERKEALLKDWEAFAKYYFPNYCTAEFSPFHKRFMKKLIRGKRIKMSRKWSRDHAKSVLAGVIAPAFLMFTGELKNMLLASKTNENAVDLLMPLQLQLESNQRILNDFGIQKGVSNWEAGRFVTVDGCSFRAIGLGQSPRGTRNQEARPDYILCDDIDDEETCRNSKRLTEAEDWVWGALFGCFSITGSKRFVIVNNQIAKDCILSRSVKRCDDHEQIDILTKTGRINQESIRSYERKLLRTEDKKEQELYTECLNYLRGGWEPSWKERFTMEDCVYMILSMGYRLSQREYFNNPFSEGKVFKKDWFQFAKLPPLFHYRFMVAYLDPGFKKTKTSDSKSLVLVALHNGQYHVRKVFCGQASIEEMVDWGYVVDALVKSKSGTYIFKMEEVFLQDLLYKDFSAAAQERGYPVPVQGDKRKKPDKDARIEGTAGYFERGDVIFDKDIEHEHHCKALVEQYLSFEPGVQTKKDGPDAMEGAFHELRQMVTSTDEISSSPRPVNKKRI